MAQDCSFDVVSQVSMQGMDNAVITTLEAACIRALGKGFGELYRAIESAEIQVPCRRFEDFAYRTRKSWSRARRVVGKAEILALQTLQGETVHLG
ncbi:MAG: hypothetical protein HGA84_06275 [Syntrophobacteraceae bacterium]|nr:hypothetical protein [Syntrophobacteraceae bacterium]